MADYRIERSVVIDAPVEVVWRTVTEPDQISRWFADAVELDATPGGHGTLVFEHDDGRPTNTAPLLVETVDPPRRFSYRWSQPEGEDPTADNSVLVEFTLTPDGPDRTHLSVVETGLERLAWSDEAKDSYAQDHRRGWAFHTDRLVRLLRDHRSAPRP